MKGFLFEQALFFELLQYLLAVSEVWANMAGKLVMLIAEFEHMN